MKIKLDWDWDYLEELENEEKSRNIKIQNDKDFKKWIKEQKNQSNKE